MPKIEVWINKVTRADVERVAKDIATKVMRGSRWQDYIPHAEAAILSLGYQIV